MKHSSRPMMKQGNQKGHDEDGTWTFPYELEPYPKKMGADSAAVATRERRPPRTAGTVRQHDRRENTFRWRPRK